MNEEAIQTMATLDRVKKACKVFSVVFTIALAILCLFFIAYIALFTYASVSGTSPMSFHVSSEEFVRMAINCALAIVVFVTTIQMLRSVTKGLSPFTTSLTKYIRRLAIVFLLYFFFDIIASPGFISFVQNDLLSFGFRDNPNVGSALIPVNLGALLVAGGFFCLSLVFEYGVLLQKLSDETL